MNKPEHQSKQQYDVIILGGGMVGATMARLLADSSLQIAVIDRGNFKIATQSSSPDVEPDFDPRVSALTPASKQLLTDIGVWQTIARSRYCPYTNMDVWDAEGTGSISFSARDIDQDELGCIVENSLVLQGLYEQLQEFDNVQLLAGEVISRLHEPATGFAALETESGALISARLVIAADGANSILRKLAGFRTREWDYNHAALVTTVRTEQAHAATARQRFMATGPLAFLPLSTGQADDRQHYCSIVWSAEPELAEQLMAMDDEQFCQHLGQAFEHRLGKIKGCAQRYSFPLRQRHAVDYVKNSIVLIGDAAHSIHPLAGQGVNLGFQDALALQQVLLSGVATGREINDPLLLQRYQRARKGHNLGMMWIMEGFKHLFAQQSLPLRWLRNVGLKSVDNVGLVKNHLARRAMGLDWH